MLGMRLADEGCMLLDRLPSLRASQRGLAFSLALALGAFGCSSDEDMPGGGGGKTDNPDEEGPKGAPTLEIGEPMAGFEVDVDEASVDGDDLRLVLRHGGGCGDHNYRLFWDGRFLETDPLQARLVVRDETDDFCEALLIQEVTFDLRPMREASGTEEGEVMLGIKNFPGDSPAYVWNAAEGDPRTIEVGDPPRATDEYIIQDARVEADSLIVDISHGGGCEEHEYQMFWDGLLLETFPPQVNLSLFHNANGDFCEAALFETLSIDLSSLPAEDGLIINLDGFDGDLILE